VAGDIGVLALQGDVSEHIRAFERACREVPAFRRSSVVEVRSPAELGGLAGLAIPGGESTTISRLIGRNGLREAILSFGGGIFATCAGMVLTARAVDDRRIRPLGLIDIRVHRNAFGRQRESFEADLDIEGSDTPFHAVFIRAPVVTAAGPGVEVLAEMPEGIVAVRQGRHMALSFHPELVPDTGLHRLFLSGLV